MVLAFQVPPLGLGIPSRFRSVAMARGLLQLERGANHHRRMEKTLQHEETTQCFGLAPTGSGNHHPDGPGTGHALTFKVDYSNGADQIHNWPFSCGTWG